MNKEQAYNRYYQDLIALGSSEEAARRSASQLSGYEPPSAPAPAKQAGFVRGIGAGAREALGSYTGAVGTLLGGQGTEVGRDVQSLGSRISGEFEPATASARAGRAIGRIGGELGTAVLGGGLALKAARGIPAVARALESGSRVQRGAAYLAAGSPIDVIQGAQYDSGMVLPGTAGSIIENLAISGAAGAILPPVRRGGRGAVDAVPEPAAVEPTREAFESARGTQRRRMQGTSEAVAQRAALEAEEQAARARAFEEARGLQRRRMQDTEPRIARRAAREAEEQESRSRSFAEARRIQRQYMEGSAQRVEGDVAQRAARERELRESTAGAQRSRVRQGMARPEVASGILGAGVGALGGALSAEEENELQQAGLGGIVGGALGGALGRRAAPSVIRAAREGLSREATSAGVGAGVGGLVGASSEDPAAGALTGAAIGAGLGFGVGRLGSARARARTPGEPSFEPVRGPDLEPSPVGRISETPTADPSARAVELVDEWFNVPRLNLSGEAETVFRDRAARVIEGNSDLLARRSVSFDQMREAAREIGMRANDADFKRIIERGELKGVDIIVARDLINSTSEDIAQLLVKRQELGLSEGAVRAIDNQLETLGSVNNALLASTAREASQRGRDLVMLKILGKYSLDRDVWLQRAKKAVGSRDLSTEEMQKVVALVDAAKTGGDEAMNKLINEIANMERSGLGQQVSAVWKAFLLSLPRTAAVNVVGNVSHAALRASNQPVATFYDYLLSNALGTQRTTDWNTDVLRAAKLGARKGFDEGFVMMGGKAAREGLREGGVRGAVTAWDQAIRTGNYTSILQKYDLNNRVNIEGSETLDLVTKFVFGIQGATDMPFRTMAYEGALSELAHVTARNSGLRRGTQEYQAAVRSMYENPTDAMRLTAIESAMDAVFAGNTRLASFFGGIKQYTSRLASSENPLTSLIGSGVDFFIPFTRVPSGVATEVVMHSPLGAVRATEYLIDLLRARSKNAPEDVARAQRQLASALAKTTTGSSLWIAGYWMAENGMLSGRRPTSAGEAAQMAEEGDQPFSFNIGDRTYSIPKALAPIGGALALGAVFYEVANNDDIEGLLQKTFATGTGVGAMAVETTALGGIRDIITSATDPRAAGRRAESIISTALVPQAIAGTARAFDPTVREPEGVLQSIQARIPGLSRSLPERLDRFGRPITRGESLGERIGQVSDPFYSRAVRTGEDPVLAELGRVGVASFAPRRAARGETAADVRRRVEFEGPLIYNRVQRLMESAAYVDRPERMAQRIIDRDPEYAGRSVEEVANEIRREMIEQLISGIRSSATRTLRSRGEL